MQERVLRCVEGLRRHGVGDAYGVVSSTTTLEFKANVLVNVRVSSASGAGARVVVDGKLGAAGGTEHVSPEQIVSDAREAAGFGPEVGELELGGAGVGDSVDDMRDAGVLGLDVPRMRALAESVVDGVRAARPDVLVDVTVSKTQGESALANSLGLVHRGAFARLSLSAIVKRNRDGDLLTLGEGGSAPRVHDERVDPSRVVARLLERLARCDRAASLPAGRYPVVFAGDGVLGLLYPLMLGLGGENLARGTSPLARSLPRLAPRFDLFSDDALYDGRGGGRDGDGHEERRVDLVRGGEIVGGLFDAATTARFRRRSPGQASFARPGCARRQGVSGSTSPGASVLAVSPGTEADVVSGVERGLLVESLLGVRMGNPISGEFSNTVSMGHLIERGEVVGRVKNVMVAGNVYEALARLDGIASTPSWVDDDAYCPSMRVESLRVASKV